MIYSPHKPEFRRRLWSRTSQFAAGFLAISLPLCNPAAQTSGRDVSIKSTYSLIPSRAALESTARQPNLLIDFARTMDKAEPKSLVDFAWIALDEMSLAYERETIGLNASEGIPMAHPKARWMLATRAYAQRLRTIADTMSEVTPVEIRVESPGMLLIYVDDQVVEVSGPRIAEPDYMGKRIIDRFCEIQACDFFVASPEPAEEFLPRNVKVIWSFSDGRGPICVTSNGLEFQFRDISQLARKRSACVQVAEQLRDLSQALRRAAATGVAIDWRAMEIISAGAGRPEQVVLNRNGDYLLLSVPSLASSRTLQQTSLAWIRAQVQGKSIFQSFPHAEQLLATLLASG